MTAKYNEIGTGYATLRKADPRIAAAIHAALGPAQTVLNVGAGTGNYEPEDRLVVAVEPSTEMIRKRASTAAPVVQATAEYLPFATDAFEAAMAVLTVHHWADKQAGLREMRRVAKGRMAVFTFDPAQRPWLDDYIPELAALDAVQMPAMSAYENWLGRVQIVPVPIPHDCSDGFLYAYWRRPEAYLDARLRSGISSFWAIKNIDARLQCLEQDLASGAWHRRYAQLLERDSYDAGYRLLIAD
jgi:SAM-dependent methyltransferase